MAEVLKLVSMVSQILCSKIYKAMLPITNTFPKELSQGAVSITTMTLSHQFQHYLFPNYQPVSHFSFEPQSDQNQMVVC